MSIISEAQRLQKIHSDGWKQVNAYNKRRFHNPLNYTFLALTLTISAYLGAAGIAFINPLKPVEVVSEVQEEVDELFDAVMLIFFMLITTATGGVFYWIAFELLDRADYTQVNRSQREFNAFLKTIDYESLSEEDQRVIADINNYINSPDDSSDNTLLYTNLALMNTNISMMNSNISNF